ncbi:MAG TPA: DsrE family protein [Acidimicrobiales bacterium]|jgi:predicted peroxiredoxin|nr:DsrE family protein [Acidimicrobiales bacterium]
MEEPSPASRRKIILYATAGPDNDDAAFSPFNMARRAADAGLEVEIVLAGPATGILRRQVRDRLTGRPQETLKALADAGVPIWVTPGCAEFRGVALTDFEETGAKPRDLSAMLIDVAEGAALITLPD